MPDNIVFPSDSGIINVQESFNVRGDGTTDDTEAIQNAIEETKGKNATLFFPKGVYLVSDQICVGGVPHSPDRFMSFQGQSESGAVIKLKDNCPNFQDASRPRIVLSLYTSDAHTGDTMHNYVRNLTIDVGTCNPGVVGLRFMANNNGAMYNVTIKSSDPAGAGKTGLDLRQSQIGPCLIKHVTIEGFECGIEAGDSFALVMEHITLRNQRFIGFLNNTARLTLRDLRSFNTVPALRCNPESHITCIEADLSGGSAGHAAIECATRKAFFRDIMQSGYRGALIDASKDCLETGYIREWYDGKACSLFGIEPASLRLPIEETPEIPWETDLSQWEKVDSAGADHTDALQSAIDRAATQGKTTVYFPRYPFDPPFRYHVSRPIRVHGSVNRIIGLENTVDVSDPTGAFENGAALLTFENLTSPAIVVERFFLLGGWECPKYVHLFQNTTDRAVVIRNIMEAGIHRKPGGTGEWFIEDVAPQGNRMSKLLFGPGETCWARQFNPESPAADMITVDGGTMWILGLKTEGRSRHIVAKNGAKVELLGGVSYQSWKNQELDPPLFTVIDSDASFTFGLYHYNLPFGTIVQETAGDWTRDLPRTALEHDHLPLYRGGGK